MRTECGQNILSTVDEANVKKNILVKERISRSVSEEGSLKTNLDEIGWDVGPT
jgi:hypothetical protein